MKIRTHLLQIWLLWALLLPAAVQAQFTYTTNNDGSLNLSQYTGSGGMVVIPGTTNGLTVSSIGYAAFQNKTTLTNVTIPASVTNIEDYAFQNCGKLTGVYFLGNAPGVDANAASIFQVDPIATNYYLPGTSGWSSQFATRPAVMLNPPSPAGSLKVTLAPAAITNVAQWQVDGGVAQPSGATVLGLSVGNHTVTFVPVSGFLTPNNLTVAINANSTATASATYNQLFYTTNNGSITITFCTGSDAVAVLPDTINGLPVTAIGSSAFENCTGLTNVTVPASITNLGSGAFFDCYRLKAIYFLGNAPGLAFGGSAFDSIATIYYLPGTSGWTSLLGGRPTVLLNPPSPAGSLKVTLSPATALTNGAQWQVDGGVVQPSGATVLDLSVGNHTVSFTAVNGFLTPDSLTVAVSANSTATASATYGQLFYTTNNGAISITYCTGSDAIEILPDSINGLPVTSIGDSAFQLCYNLTNVTIPASITNIGLQAFTSCTRLAAVYFQGNAPSLVGGGFPFPSPATIYYLPGTSGWSSQFSGRPAVMLNPPNPGGSLKVTLSPAAITNLAQWQVDGGLAQASGATVLGLSVGNHTVSFTPVTGFLTPNNQTLAVTSNSTSIASATYGELYYTTNNGALTITDCSGSDAVVVLPASINGLPVTSIGSAAFANCTGLTNVTIPATVTNIGVGAFDYSPHLAAVYFQGNAPSISPNGDAFYSGAIIYYSPGTSGWSSQFGYRTAVLLNPPNPYGSLKVTLTPAGAIAAGAQWQVDGGVVQPSGATVLGLYVGNHTVSFTPADGWAMPASQNISVNPNQTALGSATYGQYSYTTNNGAITITSFFGTAGALAIPGTIGGLPVTGIGNGAFQTFSTLTSVTIPGTVTNIGTNAFYECSHLTTITVDPANPFFSSVNGVLFNQDQTTLVQYPGGVHGSYTIPSTVTSIGDRAFMGCSSLSGVTIPGSVTNIGVSAFEYCSGLASVSIPNNVIGIGSAAFDNCSLLHSITIPDSVTSLGSQAFAYCVSLTNVTIGTNVISIGNSAFYDCPGLAGIYFLGNAPDFGSSVSYLDGNATIYYLPSATGWGAPGTLYHGYPTALWLPQAQMIQSGLDASANPFGFNITWVSDAVVVVEACTDLTNPVWTPVATNTLTGGSSWFSDPDSTNYPGRFYRLRPQ